MPPRCFADVLQKDNNVEQSTQEKQEEATEVKQAETAIVDKHDEQKEVVLKEDKSSEQREEKKQEEKKEEKKDEKAVKAAVSPLVQQYLDLKKKHPDAILLFRCGDFYETYKDDAVKASKILGITLTKSNGRKDDEGKPLAMQRIPIHALDGSTSRLHLWNDGVGNAWKRVRKSQMVQESQETEQHASLGDEAWERTQRMRTICGGSQRTDADVWDSCLRHLGAKPYWRAVTDQSQLSCRIQQPLGIKAKAYVVEEWRRSMESIRMIGPTRDSVSTKA